MAAVSIKLWNNLSWLHKNFVEYAFESFKMRIINLIPAGDHDNFVFRIGNHFKRCDQIKKLDIDFCPYILSTFYLVLKYFSVFVKIV